MVFVSAPSIILSGFGVYSLKEWLVATYEVSINEHVYWIVLFLAMTVALWLSSRKVLKAVFSRDSNESTSI